MCVLNIELVWVEIYGKREEKNTISRHSRGLVPVPNSVVPVPYVFWSTGTGTICVLVDWYRYRYPMFRFGPA